MTVCKVLDRIHLPNGKPDLRSQVRLFASALDNLPGKLVKIRAYFKVYLIGEDEAILGSNHQHMEIRLYFIKCRNVSDEIFLIFFIDTPDWLGMVRSAFLRPILLFSLRKAVRICKNSDVIIPG